MAGLLKAIVLGGVSILFLLGKGEGNLGNACADNGEGKKIYTTHCLSCHGRRGDGRGVKARGLTPPPPDFTDPSFWKNKTEPYLFHVIQNGMGSMPGSFDTLSPDSIEDVLSYIRSFRR